jgi:hypothetical protein
MCRPEAAARALTSVRTDSAAQGGVARRMPEPVVDLLEPVDVEHQERQRRAAAARGRERALELLVERAAVGQPGEGVLERPRLQRHEQPAGAVALGQDREGRERERHREGARVDDRPRRRLEHAHHDRLHEDHRAQHQGVAPQVQEAGRVEHGPQEEELRAGARVAGREVQGPHEEGGEDRRGDQHRHGHPLRGPEAGDPRARGHRRDHQRGGEHRSVPGEARHDRADGQAEETARQEEQAHGPARADPVAGRDPRRVCGRPRAVHGAPRTIGARSPSAR